MADKTTDPKTVLEFVKKNNVKLLDLRFTDLPGLWHHVSYPIDQLSEDSFEEGFGMDGSSIRGWEMSCKGKDCSRRSYFP